MFSPPTRTIRIYYQNTDGEVATDRVTAGAKNVKVMDDLDYAVKPGGGIPVRSPATKSSSRRGATTT